MKVLVIDDDVMTTEWATIFLESENIETQTAGSIISALECIRSSMPDLIISDVTLKGEDVFELLDELSTDVLTRRIPVIAVTGHILKESEKARFYGYLLKPFEPKALLKLVRQLERQLQNTSSDK